MNIIINNNISINLLIFILGYLAIRLHLNKTSFLNVLKYKEEHGVNIKRGFFFTISMVYLYLYLFTIPLYTSFIFIYLPYL